jgi:predicted RNA binding protein YcfA (HicA-like mRNA interferase family)
MKIPRDITGADLVKLLKPFGYEISRQKGSHIRLTTYLNGEHHITIPNHDPLKIGTLMSILSEIALHFNINRNELIEKIFS